MAEKIANVLAAEDGQITTLSAAILSTGATTISTTGAFPTGLRTGTCRIRIDDEIMVATVDGSGAVTSVTRGAEGSTAATHSNGAAIRHVLTAGAVTGLIAASGGLPISVVTIAGDYSPVAGRAVLVDAEAAPRTVTLPDAPAGGAMVTVKKMDAGSNAVSVVPAGDGQIDYILSSYEIAIPLSGATFVHVGENYWFATAIALPPSAQSGSGVPYVATDAELPATATLGLVILVLEDSTNLDDEDNPQATLRYGNGSEWVPIGLAGGGTVGGGTEGDFIVLTVNLAGRHNGDTLLFDDDTDTYLTGALS